MNDLLGKASNLIDGSRILVVGGAGFIGSNLIKMLLSLNLEVEISVVDNLLSSERRSLPDDARLKFVEGSIADDQILGSLEDIYDYVFHLATFHGNQNSIFDPIADHENNAFATLKILNYMKKFKRIRKFVYSSAGCVTAEKTFNKPKATYEDATISIKQDSPYAISKLIGEFYSVYFHSSNKTPVVRARFQNVYGPGEILGAGKWRGTTATVWRNVVPTFIYKALKGMPLPLENSGIATRDFVFVEDICKGLILCGTEGHPGDVYNIASGIETSIAELAHFINRLTGNKAGLLELPRRNWDTSGKRFGSVEKSLIELKFKAQVGLEEGLKSTIEWTKKNVNFIDECINKHAKYL